ncbi:MAG: short-subunit dehydrogenase [Arenicella sp.]|jgi:short-subunit dehydrogenase
MKNLNNAVAVITGAGSGIGRHLSLKLADAGASVAISDINIEGLKETESLLQSKGVKVVARQLDVSNRDAVFEYALQTEADFGKVNLVINNAGVLLSSGTFRDTSIDDFEWLMSINFSGVLYGTKAFLPILDKAEWGHIVNISSLFGLIGVQEQSSYNASKFAVRGMTESLRQELDEQQSSVSCTSVHPGGIKTSIASNARVTIELDENMRKLKDNFEAMAITTPGSAAEQIINAVHKNKRRLVIGMDAKFLDLVQRLFPNHYQKCFNWIVNRELAKQS